MRRVPLTGLSVPRRGRDPYAVTAMLLVLLLGTFALGLLHLALARPLFLLGCLGVSHRALRDGPAGTVEVAIILFAFTPFLRRVVDYGVGYDESALMLLGPVLAILLPTLELRHLLLGQRRGGDGADLAPMILVALCLGYAMILSVLEGMLVPGAVALLKNLAPMLFGIWVMCRARRDDTILAAAVRAFLLVTPVMGLYAILQYLDPPGWDRYWMLYAKMDSIGTPEPFQVRVFSTMNSPASYATFAACGLLLFGFCRQGWQAVLLALPVAVGLLLTLYRTAWISLAVSISYCALFPRTRGRAGLLAALVAMAALLATSTTDFGAAIAERLATLGGSVAEDGSGRARLDQFRLFYEQLDGALLGTGLAGTRDTYRAADGEVFGALLNMGLIAGPLYLGGLVWAGLRAVARIRPQDGPTRLVIGAGILGTLSQMPLASITSGELGLLFWLLVGLATGGAPEDRLALGRPDGSGASFLGR